MKHFLSRNVNALIKLFNHCSIRNSKCLFKKVTGKKSTQLLGRLGSTLSVGVHRAAELQGNSWIENKVQQHAVGLF